MEKFVITKSEKYNVYKATLFAKNEMKILSTDWYNSIIAIENGIEGIRKYSLNKNNFNKLIDENGEYYFVLKAENGQVIGRSQVYYSEAARDNGIASVMKYAETAEVIKENL